MKHALKSITGCNSQGSARVVDGKLILSFPHAITPVVWQMDLTQVKASALEVHENKDKGTATLVLKTPGGANTDIAPFEQKSQAVSALMAVSRALESAQGQIRPTAAVETINYGGARRSSGFGKALAVILGLVLLFILVNIWGSNLPQAPAGYEGNSADATATSAPVETGVPLSADEFLNSQ